MFLHSNLQLLRYSERRQNLSSSTQKKYWFKSQRGQRCTERVQLRSSTTADPRPSQKPCGGPGLEASCPLTLKKIQAARGDCSPMQKGQSPCRWGRRSFGKVGLREVAHSRSDRRRITAEDRPQRMNENCVVGREHNEKKSF